MSHPQRNLFQRTQILAVAILFVGSATAQDCSIPFTVPMFGVQIESDVLYGVAPRYNGNMDSLRLNLYRPVGDGQTERPLILVIHGGGFVNGHRNEMNPICQTLASMGWAAATISYRLGFYGTGILDPPYAYDGNEFRRANYRAMQDTKGAIRFLKDRHLADSTSTENVLLLGFSAGGFAALHASYLDIPEEKPAAAGVLGGVQHFTDLFPRPDLGPVEGTLNLNDHDASVLGVASMFGALMDTAYIEGADDPALYMYHQTQDPVVGCGVQQPYWGIPFGPSGNYPWTFGSCAIDQHVQQLGFAPGRYHFQLHQGIAHDLHDPPGVLLESFQWMRELFCNNSTSIDGPVGRKFTLEIFPNPSNGNFTIQTSADAKGEVTILDPAGRIVHRTLHTGPATELHLRGTAAGMYTVVLTTDGDQMIQRMVIEQDR